MPANTRSITVLGAGILGLWQALTLARAGHRVRLIEISAEPFADAASLYGGVMLAPEREAETAPAMLRQLGREGVALWRNFYPALRSNGSIVVAAARDRGELERFARRTQGHRLVDGADLGALEPDLGGRFTSALYFPEEAHMPAPAALAFMLAEVQRGWRRNHLRRCAARAGWRDDRRLPRAWRRAMCCRTCAAYAASVL